MNLVRSVCGFWRTLLRRITGRLLYPLTPEQLRAEENNFTAAISREAIRALASRYNDNLPCRIRDETSQGSFNVCFYADFFTVGTTWVVRVPIEPTVSHAWEKLQSEVYTMQYVKAKTKIPIPQVHAYGRAQLLNNRSTTQAFMIMDCVPGYSFTQERYWEGSADERRQFFSNLIDILVELYNLELPAAGSLMPNQDGDGEPAIVGAFSISRNTLLRNGYWMQSSAAKSTAQFLEEQFWILEETYKMPVEDLSREDLEMEVFALHDLKKRIFKALGDSKNPFVLTHTDLRRSNIMVDQSLRITGIVDWEWSSAIPRELFPFPRWIHDFDRRNFYDMRQEFRGVLQSKREDSIAHSQLADKWHSNGDQITADDDNDVASSISRIFRDPHHLTKVYFGDIYQYYFSRPEEEEVADFFLRPENKSLLKVVKRRLDNCERYAHYLKGRSLYVEDVRGQKVKDLLKMYKPVREKTAEGELATEDAAKEHVTNDEVPKEHMLKEEVFWCRGRP